jgi:hypothetical protein
MMLILYGFDRMMQTVLIVIYILLNPFAIL